MNSCGYKAMKRNKQINWVCQECGIKFGRGISRTQKQMTLSTWHIGKCGVCKATKQVTEPRDFGYLTI